MFEFEEEEEQGGGRMFPPLVSCKEGGGGGRRRVDGMDVQIRGGAGGGRGTTPLSSWMCLTWSGRRGAPETLSPHRKGGPRPSLSLTSLFAIQACAVPLQSLNNPDSNAGVEGREYEYSRSFAAERFFEDLLNHYFFRAAISPPERLPPPPSKGLSSPELAHGTVAPPQCSPSWAA